MDFAKKQLLKYGWVEGQGLGKEENGITNPIKVSIKRDNGGVGLTPGEEFSDHWWSAVFNKAASNISVSCDSKQDRVSITLQSGAEEATSSLRRKHYNHHRRSLLYGGFLDSTRTYQPDKKERLEHYNSDVEKSNKERDIPDVPLVKHCRITDEELLQACRGRTAHKAARHGMLLSGKLKRIEQQESCLESSVPQHHSDRDKVCSCEDVEAEVTLDEIKKLKPKKRKCRTNRIDAASIKRRKLYTCS